MNGITYTAPVSRNGGENYAFDVNTGSRTILVRISREAIEDYVGKLGLPQPTSDEKRLEWLETYQPEFKHLALEKVRPGETIVLITSENVADVRG